MKPLVSMIIPVFNEQDNITAMHNTVTKVLNQLTNYDYEIIFIDDGSTDTSWDTIKECARHNIRAKGIRLSRNFGQQYAATAGYDYATGTIIITMDGDLQHPPSLISLLIEQWEKGFLIVYPRRINRKEPFLKRLAAAAHYWLLNKIAVVNIQPNVSEFRLIDKKVLDTLKKLREHQRYLRGLVAWTGFRHTFIEYQAAPREVGTTSYTLSKLIAITLNGIVGFSYLPLTIARIAGITVTISGMLLIGIYISNYTVSPTDLLILVLYECVGILFLGLWLLGAYLMRTAEGIRSRPLYIIDEHC